jgi:hypothetical protein
MPFSPKKPQTMIGTFAGMLIFVMIKEGIQDLQRAKADK